MQSLGKSLENILDSCSRAPFFLSLAVKGLRVPQPLPLQRRAPAIVFESKLFSVCGRKMASLAAAGWVSVRPLHDFNHSAGTKRLLCASSVLAAEGHTGEETFLPLQFGVYLERRTFGRGRKEKWPRRDQGSHLVGSWETSCFSGLRGCWEKSGRGGEKLDPSRGSRDWGCPWAQEQQGCPGDCEGCL